MQLFVIEGKDFIMAAERPDCNKFSKNLADVGTRLHHFLRFQ